MAEDFSNRIRDTRKKLIEAMLRYRDEDKIAYLRYDKLIVKDKSTGNIKKFTYNTERQEIISAS